MSEPDPGSETRLISVEQNEEILAEAIREVLAEAQIEGISIEVIPTDKQDQPLIEGRSDGCYAANNLQDAGSSVE